VAGVPFVDVMNTMSDPSIPLTSGEWEEWGNPNEYKYVAQEHHEKKHNYLGAISTMHK
jgi:protease II